MGALNIRIGPLVFDHPSYDMEGDVLYLHTGPPRAGEARRPLKATCSDSLRAPNNRRADGHQCPLPARAGRPVDSLGARSRRGQRGRARPRTSGGLTQNSNGGPRTPGFTEPAGGMPDPTGEPGCQDQRSRCWCSSCPATVATAIEVAASTRSQRRGASRARPLVLAGSSSAASRALTIASRAAPAELYARGRLLTARRHEREQAPRRLGAHCCFA
jgi:hypothetical protein